MAVFPFVFQCVTDGAVLLRSGPTNEWMTRSRSAARSSLVKICSGVASVGLQRYCSMAIGAVVTRSLERPLRPGYYRSWLRYSRNIVRHSSVLPADWTFLPGPGKGISMAELVRRPCRCHCRSARREKARSPRERIKLSLRTVEREVAPLRRELEAEARATIHFETPPGKQLQIDFGERRALIGGESVKVYLFVATLGYSRRLPRSRREQLAGSRRPPRRGRRARPHALRKGAAQPRGSCGSSMTNTPRSSARRISRP